MKRAIRFYIEVWSNVRPPNLRNMRRLLEKEYIQLNLLAMSVAMCTHAPRLFTVQEPSAASAVTTERSDDLEKKV